MESEDTKQVTLCSGMEIVLHAETSEGRISTRAEVYETDQGIAHIKTCDPGVAAHDLLLIECVVPGEGRYVGGVSVESRDGESIGVRANDPWQRVQERADFRIPTHGLSISVSRPEKSSNAAEAGRGRRPRRTRVAPPPERLVDISAGGLRFRTEPGLEAGDRVVCHFELPREACFVLPGRVVRIEVPASSSAVSSYAAVQFDEIDSNVRGQIISWVFSEQTRRHRLRG